MVAKRSAIWKLLLADCPLSSINGTHPQRPCALLSAGARRKEGPPYSDPARSSFRQPAEPSDAGEGESRRSDHHSFRVAIYSLSSWYKLLVRLERRCGTD